MKKIKVRSKGIVSCTVCAAMFLMQPWQVVKASSDVPVNTIMVKSATNTSAQNSSLITVNEFNTVRDTTSISEETSDNRVKARNGSCKKEGCNLFVEVDKSEQVMYVYVGGELQNTYPVSTGKRGHETPNLDLKPAGPMYRSYTSTKYPEGDYNGLGNMPYAVFLRGGYAIHGTTKGSIPKLGSKASHGCIRLHPEDASQFYELVKSIGLENTWVTVHP